MDISSKKTNITENWYVVYVDNCTRPESNTTINNVEWILNLVGIFLLPIVIVFPILLIPLYGGCVIDGVPQLDQTLYIIFQMVYNIMAFFTILIPFPCAIPSPERVVLIPLVFGLSGIFIIYYCIFFISQPSRGRTKAIVSFFRPFLVL